MAGWNARTRSSTRASLRSTVVCSDGSGRRSANRCTRAQIWSLPAKALRASASASVSCATSSPPPPTQRSSTGVTSRTKCSTTRDLVSTRRVLARRMGHDSRHTPPLVLLQLVPRANTRALRTLPSSPLLVRLIACHSRRLELLQCARHCTCRALTRLGISTHPLWPEPVMRLLHSILSHSIMALLSRSSMPRIYVELTFFSSYCSLSICIHNSAQTKLHLPHELLLFGRFISKYNVL